MKTSARNQFLGKIVEIKEGAVNAEVALDIGGDELIAGITLDSLKHLNLTEGMEVYGLIKAQWIILCEDNNLKTSARNRLCGTIARCHEGAVNSEVILELPGGKHLTAIITNESYRELGFKPGIRACALIKASHVILAVAS